MEDRLPRKLAAILYADVAEYSRLTGQDEDATHRTLSGHLDQISSTIESHRGQVMHYAGDAVLAKFDAVVDAVASASAIQKQLAEKNRGLPIERKVQFRIGVNLGDVIEDRGDIYGDGVNVAARLESLADPGSICVSESVHTAVGNRLMLDFKYIGEQSVKNIGKPVRVYKVNSSFFGADTDSHPDRQYNITQESKAIAVLPFTNISDDPEQEYFSDGLTEDLITALTLWRLFPVIARNSTFSYKGKAVDVSQIASELGARYVLEGSVRKDGNRVRISAQLIDGKTAHHIWAEKYDRELNDIFSLQDEITQKIAAMIVPEVRRAELTRSAKKRQIDLDAWDYYLRGIAFINEFSKENNANARDMFRCAIELDPNYSDAYVGLAWSYHRDLLMQCTDNRKEAIAQALEASRRAVALDSASSIAHQVLSTAHIWRNEHDLALAEARVTVELNPNDAIGLHGLGNKSDLAGDPEGIPRMLRAQQLNPQDPDRHMNLTFLARAYVNIREHEKAIECARLAIQRRADYPHAYFILAIALGHVGRAREARNALDKCERLQPGFIESRASWRPYADEGRNQYLLAGFEKAKGAK